MIVGHALPDVGATLPKRSTNKKVKVSDSVTCPGTEVTTPTEPVSTAEIASKTIHHESIGPVVNQMVFRMTAAVAVPSTAGSEPDVDVQDGEIAKDEPVRMPVDREISGLVAISTRTSLQLRILKALVHIQGSLPNRPLCKLRLISCCC